MFAILRNKVRFILVFMLLSIASVTTGFAQTGEFEQYVNANGWSGNVAFNVPYSSSPLPLIIALHPAQTPETAMRQMMNGAASQINAILVCPSGPDGDGSAIMPLIEWCKANYKVDDKKIFLTGYSAGSYPTFTVGFPNYKTFRGLIGIAGAYTQGMTQEAVSGVGIGLICGKNDQYYSNMKSFETQVKNMGGYVKFHEKNGVGHTGQYFWSSEFTTDWVDLYNFCLDIVFKPAKITLNSPENGLVDVVAPVTLNWEIDENATSYEVEISDDDKVIETKTRTTNSYVVKTLEAGKQYYWKVRGINSSGEGTWSNEWRFTSKPVAPKVSVKLLEPEDGAKDLSKDIYFRWEEIEQATEYHIQVLKENDSVFIEYNDVTIGFDDYVEKQIRNLDKNTTFKWQVRGKNSAGEGPWSEQRTFTTAPGKPTDKVQLSEPPNNQTDVSTLTSLKWNIIQGATKYHLQFKIDSEDDLMIDDSSVSAPAGSDLVNYSFAKELLGLTKFKWRVRGANIGGYGPWSDYSYFTTWDPTGVDDYVSYKSNILIYPNPANQFVNIEFLSDVTGNVNIELFDVLGQKIKSYDLNTFNLGNNSAKLDLNEITSGTYYLNFKFNSESFKKVLVVMP